MGLICFASYEIHPTTAGGCGVLIHHAVDQLTAEGHQALLLLDLDVATFVQFVEHDRLGFARPGLVRAARVDDLCEDFAPLPGASIFQIKSLRFAHALTKLLATEPITLVEFFEYCGPGYYTFVQRLFATPEAGPVLASRVHGSVEVLERFGGGLLRDEAHFMQHSMERRSLALSETIFVPTRSYFDAYYRPLYHIPDERVVVSSPPKQPFPKVNRRPEPGQPFSIAFIGRIFHLKGVDQLVHAAVGLMKARPELNFTVDLIGYDSADGPLGSYTEFLRTLIPARLRHRFEFLGQMGHQAIAQRLERALFAVFPNRVESFCYALHEAYDAGIPVIANALPAFTDFFHHERNCLLYDGTTQGLASAMNRLINDAPLRSRITRPYPVADHPLADVYSSPRALEPLCPTTSVWPEPSLVVVLCPDQATPVGDLPAVRSLRAQASRAFRVVCLTPGASQQGETLWWCGHPWTPCDWEGRPLDPGAILTSTSLAVFDYRDEIHPSWLLLCRRGLRPGLGFTGSWVERDGVTQAGTLDLTPELAPFRDGAMLQRVLLQTQPERPLGEILDPSLGELGHLGLIWETIQRIGPGVLLPRPLIRVADGPAPASDASIKSLLLRHGKGFGDRLMLATGLLALEPRRVAGPTLPPSSPAPSSTIEDKIAIANELGGSVLACLALRKITRRLTHPGEAPQEQ